MTHLSSLPSVEKLLQTAAAHSLSESYGRPLTIQAIRARLDDARQRLRSETMHHVPAVDEILADTADLLQEWTRFSLRPVINATGVILHTNLGRAPLSRATMDAMERIARAYSNLELDLETGKRGGRSADVEAALCRLTGAEAGLVVNNNAAAVLLTLAALASRRGVAVARSQLVEIGGGFRMPDVMRQSGAKLVEVGTTNKVRLSDYEEVLPKTAVVLRAHRSNFKMIGFTEEPDLKSMVDAAHAAGRIVVDDLGSGALLDTEKYGLSHEPTVQESLTAGADVVCFSGDKLLGGPQAGIIVGRAELVAKIAKHPLARAVRADKVTLAGIAATLMHYLRNEAEAQVPVWRMVAMSTEEIRRRANQWVETIGRGTVQAGNSTLGGGSLPGDLLPTYVVSLEEPHPDAILTSLRRQDPPVVARTEKGSVLLDPRTVQPDEDRALMEALGNVLTETR